MLRSQVDLLKFHFVIVFLFVVLLKFYFVVVISWPNHGKRRAYTFIVFNLKR